MKSIPLVYRLQRLIALLLALTVFNLSATVAFASLPGSAVAFGTLKVSGGVTVNEDQALSGQTIPSGSHIITASKSNSILELGNFTRLILSEQTDLALDFTAASIAGSLREGGLRASIPAARTLSITTPDGVVATDSSQAVVFTVQVKADGTRISVETGRVELRVGNNRRVLAAGERFSTDCDSLTVLGYTSSCDNQRKISGTGRGPRLRDRTERFERWPWHVSLNRSEPNNSAAPAPPALRWTASQARVNLLR